MSFAHLLHENSGEISFFIQYVHNVPFFCAMRSSSLRIGLPFSSWVFLPSRHISNVFCHSFSGSVTSSIAGAEDDEDAASDATRSENMLLVLRATADADMPDCSKASPPLPPPPRSLFLSRLASLTRSVSVTSFPSDFNASASASVIDAFTAAFLTLGSRCFVESSLFNSFSITSFKDDLIALTIASD